MFFSWKFVASVVFRDLLKIVCRTVGSKFSICPDSNGNSTAKIPDGSECDIAQMNTKIQITHKLFFNRDGNIQTINFFQITFQRTGRNFNISTPLRTVFQLDNCQFYHNFFMIFFNN